MRSIALIVALLGCAAALPMSGARTLKQATVPGTNVLMADLSTRAGSGAGLLRPGAQQQIQQQTQAAIRTSARTGTGNRAANPLQTNAATRVAGRTRATARSAVGQAATQSAVQQAVRSGDARQGAKAGAGIAEVTTRGRGKTITSSGTRAGLAGMGAQRAVQSAAQGRTTAGQAAATGQATSQGSMIRTSFNPATGVGARATQG